MHKKKEYFSGHPAVRLNVEIIHTRTKQATLGSFRISVWHLCVNLSSCEEHGRCAPDVYPPTHACHLRDPTQERRYADAEQLQSTSRHCRE